MRERSKGEVRRVTCEEVLLLLAYRAWSEEYWAASFIEPSRGTVGLFREWLARQREKELEAYEEAFLEEEGRQEREEGT